jgi:hypothetical protein
MGIAPRDLWALEATGNWNSFDEDADGIDP